mmetsp:Transcript_20024/g.43387  ORF Transcript_20024/g.43387 Transcript_20024/m.43387 type:complete len:484 (-) Transcript_20024:5185-6636(-)
MVPVSNTMDPEDLNKELESGAAAAPRSLLQDDEPIAPMESSNSLPDSIGGVGGGGGDEQDDENNTPQSRRQIPTIAFVVVPMVLVTIAIFLLAVFMPKTPTQDEETTPNTTIHELHDDFVAATNPIFLTSSNQSPTGIHISLTGKASEMNIQFVTGDSGEALVEYAKKSDINLQRATTITTVGRKLLQVQEGLGVSWTKVKGVSTTYVATDMCQEPATSTEPGFFVSPGHLHTVKATNLEPNTEYVYRVGLGFGQGIKWSEKYFDFRSSPPPGSGPPSPNKPALTFLALANQGCHQGEDPPSTLGGNSAQQVAQLIVSMIDKRTIDSIHHIGGLSYADGAAHVWDAWIDMIQPYASRVPVMVGVGNHEYDHTLGGGGGRDPSGITTEFGFQPNWGEGAFNSNTGGECGVPVSKRFAVPDNGNGVFWYSHDQSLVHTVMLSSEHNITKGSKQYIWLEEDLAAVNRIITPWVVVEMSRPVYSKQA